MPAGHGDRRTGGELQAQIRVHGTWAAFKPAGGPGRARGWRPGEPGLGAPVCTEGRPLACPPEPQTSPGERPSPAREASRRPSSSAITGPRAPQSRGDPQAGV